MANWKVSPTFETSSSSSSSSSSSGRGRGDGDGDAQLSAAPPPSASTSTSRSIIAPFGKNVVSFDTPSTAGGAVESGGLAATPSTPLPPLHPGAPTAGAAGSAGSAGAGSAAAAVAAGAGGAAAAAGSDTMTACGVLGLSSIFTGKFLQAKRRKPHRVQFFGGSCGVFEQWELLGRGFVVVHHSFITMYIPAPTNERTYKIVRGAFNRPIHVLHTRSDGWTHTGW